MEVQLDEASGEMLRAAMERLGVTTHLSRRTTRRARRHAHQRAAVRRRLAAGLRHGRASPPASARTSAWRATPACTVERGIVVGDDLRSANDPSIFAIGECAQHRGQVYGLVAPLWEQAQVLADRLTDSNAQAAYRGSRVSTKLKVMGVDLAVMGDKEPAAGDEVVHYSEPSRGVYKKMVVRDGQLAGAILLGDPDGAPALQQAFDRALALPDNRAELLFPAMRAEAPLSAADLPDDAQICNCNGVTKGALTTAIADGCRSLRALVRRDPRRHWLRIVQAAGAAGPRGSAGDARRRRSRRALLRAGHAAAKARARRRDPRAQPAQRLRRLRGAGRRPRGRRRAKPDWRRC